MGTYSDPALILPGAVGQTELDASSKKDVVGGVAALDASGFLLAKGAGILFPRTGSNDVHIYERTSGEEAYAFHRVGADDYTFYIKESNVWKRFQTESMKDVVNGIAALDAAGELLVAGPKIRVSRDVGDSIFIVERTSGESVALFKRMGVSDFEGKIQTASGWHVMLHTGDKDVVNGIAGLDANGRVLSEIGGVPSGVIFPYGGSSAPSGYLLCNGAAVSRTTYSLLFAAIGVAFGVGDGSTTFNIPDMQGNVPVGIGASGVTNRGDTGGEQTHTLILAETPAHSHTTPSRGSDGTDTSILRQANAGGVSNTATSSKGSGNAHQNMQPYVGTEYIIKV